MLGSIMRRSKMSLSAVNAVEAWTTTLGDPVEGDKLPTIFRKMAVLDFSGTSEVLCQLVTMCSFEKVRGANL
jgi:hypothetical protein